MVDHFGKGYAGNPPQNYERFFVPAIGAPLAAELVRLAALSPGDRVLDVACGTGVVARMASEQVGETGTVVGLDVNPGMIAVARAAAPPGLSIEWHEASADSMPFPDASFDVVLCQMGLQFMPDKPAVLAEIRRVLARDGRLVLNLPGPTPQLFTIMGEALSCHVGEEAMGFVNQVFSLHDADALEDLIREAGFRDISLQSDTKRLPLPAPEAFLWQYVQSTPLAALVAQLDDEGRDTLETEVVTKWADFVVGDRLVLDVRVTTATALR
ncbi:MAG: methyltransferase domain-containing protein [Rhodothermia bacterium]|nr:methyltransferase domain-containing protein [Rhodothermia bacterium]